MRIDGNNYQSVFWNYSDGTVQWIEQRLLPHRFELACSDNPVDIVTAIETMQVRGAPSIGAAAAFGLALAWQKDVNHFHSYWLPRMRKTRPTAVNLFHACDIMAQFAETTPSDKAMIECAQAYADSEVIRNRSIGDHLAPLLARGHRRVLTHCNAGWLAAVDWGTATSGIYQLAHAGERPFVWVDETRPRLQGARLTAWELKQEGVDCCIQVDGAAAWRIKKGEVDVIIVGADRIAGNGDVANKIGTYALSLAAREHDVPMYVVAPSSTFDSDCCSGDFIPIENRDESEVLFMECVDENGLHKRERIGAFGVMASNPAFDVTPFENITAIISEHGVWQPTLNA